MARVMRVYAARGRRRWLWWLLAPLALLGVALVWWHDSAPQGRTHTVVVTAVDESGAPLPGAQIVGLLDTAQVPVSQWPQWGAAADAQGRRVFSQVAPGSYWLEVEGAAHLFELPASAPARVEFAAAAAPEYHAFTLTLADGAGRPAAGKRVTFTPYPGGDAPAFAGETDWRGVLVWERAPAGVYVVEAGASRCPLVLEPGAYREAGAALEWLPESGVQSATVRLLKGGGRPVAGARVDEVLYGLPSGKEFLLGSFETGADGGFCWEDVPPGTHTLRIEGKRFKFTAPVAGGLVEFLL